MGFLLFFFSGLIVKAQTLPEWTQPWLPSVSVIRWVMQGMTINEFDDSDLFPVAVTPLGTYNSYNELLSLFGWGGKTKYECLANVAYNMLIYRVISYFALAVRASWQVGTAAKAKVSDEDRLY